MAYSGFKGIGPNKIGCGDKGSPAKKYGAMKGDQSASRKDYRNYKGTDKGYRGKDGSSHGDQSASKADYTSPAKKYDESVAKKALKGNQNKLPDHLKAKIEAAPGKKMNKGMSYDIKEASNQSLSKSARKHYAENAQAANKGGYGDKEKGSPAKQAKSKKEMKYDKTAQKAENAVSKDNMGKNSRLIDKANKLNKKNNLGKQKLAKG